MNNITDTVGNYECTFANVFDSSTTSDFKCDWVANKGCADKQDFLNFFQIFLCGFNGSLLAMVPFVLISLFFIFKFICALVD
jgi:hypothetical protein